MSVDDFRASKLVKVKSVQIQRGFEIVTCWRIIKAVSSAWTILARAAMTCRSNHEKINFYDYLPIEDGIVYSLSPTLKDFSR